MKLAKARHVSQATNTLSKSHIHTLSLINYNCNHIKNGLPSGYNYNSKRYWNKRNQFRLTKKQRHERKEHEKRFANSLHEDSNYFPEVDVDTQTIPISMKPPPQNSKTPHKPLKLDDNYWKHWESVEKSLNLESLHKEIESNVNQILSSFDHKIRFANPSDKSKVFHLKLDIS